MRMRKRRRVRTARHQPGEMGHVHQQPGTDPVGDCAKALEVHPPRHGGAAGDQQLGPVLLSQFRDRIVVDAAILPADTVLNRVEPFARLVWPGTVRQVPA